MGIKLILMQMKTKNFKMILLLLVFGVPSFVNSQVVYSKKFKPPQVNIELLFSYSQPLPNMYGTISDFFAFKNYGVKNGLPGAQINVKLSADKKGRILPYLSLAYALFYGRDNGTAFIDSNIINSGYPLPGSTLYNTVSGSSKIYIHNFSAGLGFSYAFTNKTRWTPHLDAEADLNILFGTYRQTPYNAAEVSFTIKNAVRFGFGVGAGIQVRLSKAFGLALTTKYKFANILGKSSETLHEQNKMTLLDKANTGINSYLSKDRQIQYIEMMLGVSFYIGRK
jgi:hypothetical protein